MKNGRRAERKRRGEKEQSKAKGKENGKNNTLARIKSSQLPPSRTTAYDLANYRHYG